MSFATRELVFRARGGDSLAVETLYARYLPVLQRWARGRMPARGRDLNDTGDLVQETLIKSLHRLSSVEIDRPGDFFAYLRTALLNRIRDEARRVNRTPVAVRMNDVHAARDASPVEEMIGHERLEQYERAMETLSLDDREAIMTRIELNLTYAEVAMALGKPSADAARMAVTRALAKLASAMAA